MMKETPPNEDFLETFTDDRELPIHATEEQKIDEIFENNFGKRSNKELIEDEAKIAEIKQSISVKKSIAEALEKKDDGSQSFTDSRQPSEKKPWISRVPFMLGLAGLLGLAPKAEGQDMAKTVPSKTPDIAMTKGAPGDFIKNTPIDLKKYEQFGISRADELKTNDTTKHILLISIPEYRNYGDVFTILKKAGLEPSSVETMDEAAIMNEEIFKKAGSVISLKERVNKLGKPSFSTITWDERNNEFNGESREIQVMKGGPSKKNTSNFDSDFDRYRFVVEVPKEVTIADYASGVIKN